MNQPDRLSEALTKLCMDALHTYQDKHRELVAQFIHANPEIGLVDGLKEAVKLVLRESTQIGKSTTLSRRAHAALAEAYAQAGGDL